MKNKFIKKINKKIIIKINFYLIHIYFLKNKKNPF